MATNNREQKYIFVPLKKKSEGRLNLQRIESSTGDGVPDVIGCNRSGRGFWLELKFMEAWPVRESTMPFKGKFEKGQLSFLSCWNDWHFPSYVLLKVDSEGFYYLIHPSIKLKEYNKREVLAAAVCSGSLDNIILHLEHF